MNLHKIWRIPVYLPYLQPALTDEIIIEAEKKIGYKLPKEYLELMRIQNGGYIRYTIEDTPHSQIYGIGPYFSSILGFEGLKEYEGALSYEVDGLIPFDGDGHWNICLDYRKNKIDPEITYIDTETDHQKNIAKDFKEYLSLLKLNIDDLFVIDNGASIEALVKEISEVAQITFGEPDYFAHGYPIYKSKYKDSWVLIRPNKVPAGFVRKNHERYNELKEMMKPYALCWPELTETDLLIDVFDEPQRQELFGLLISKGMTIRDVTNIVKAKNETIL